MEIDVTLSDSQAKRLAEMLASLEAIGAKLTLAQLTCLLVIGLEPGLSVNELADRTGMPQQSASRNVSILLGRYYTSIPGDLNESLISQEISVTDPRKRALFLNKAGSCLLHKMVSSAPAEMKVL